MAETNPNTPTTVERARMRREAIEQVARANATEATGLRIDLVESRLVETWQAGRLDSLERLWLEAKAAHERALGAAEVAATELHKAQDALGMVVWDDPVAAVARIREEAAAAERERWSTALGLSSPETAKAYIGKLEREVEDTGKPTPHQPAAGGGGGGGGGAIVNMTSTAGPGATEPATDKPAAEGKRRATPRRERVTIAELCAAVAEVRSRTLGPASMTEQLPAALVQFVGKTVVATPAGEQPAPAAPEPTTDAEPARVLATPGDRHLVAWRPMDNARRLMLARSDRFQEHVLATVAPDGPNRREISTILGDRDHVAITETVAHGPTDIARVTSSLEETADQRAEVAIVDSFAAVIANLTGRDVLLGAARAKPPEPAAGAEP